MSLERKKKRIIDNYKSIDLCKISDERLSFMTVPKTDSKFQNYREKIKLLINKVSAQLENDPFFKGKYKMSYLFLVRALFIQNFDTLSLEKTISKSLLIKRIVIIHQEIHKNSKLDIWKVTTNIVNILVQFLKKCVKGVLEFDLTEEVELWNSILKCKKFLRPFHNESNLLSCTRLEKQLILDLFLEHKLRIYNEEKVDWKVDQDSKLDDDRLLTDEDELEAEIKKREIQNQKDLEASKPEKVQKMIEDDPRSSWAKKIDICLERKDLFKMDKEEFNNLFDIKVGINEDVKGLENHNLNQNQKRVLTDLYEFNFYLNRNMITEKGKLRRNMDILDEMKQSRTRKDGL